MKSAISALFLSAAGALAAPAETLTTRDSHPSHIDPVLSQFNVFAGAIDYDTGYGHIYKSYTADPDITTLVEFAFPESTRGHECQLIFELDSTATTTGSQRAQVFSSLAPAEHDTSSWPHGNLRDLHIGDAYFEAGTGVKWENTYSPYAGERFPCPAGYSLAGELVGRWDEVEIKWDQKLTGPYVKVY